jgi:hypothetical protein
MQVGLLAHRTLQVGVVELLAQYMQQVIPAGL